MIMPITIAKSKIPTPIKIPAHGNEEVGGGPVTVTLDETSKESAVVFRETVPGCWDVDNIGGNVLCLHGTVFQH